MSWQTQYQQYDQYGQYNAQPIAPVTANNNISIYQTILGRCNTLLQTAEKTHPNEYKDGLCILNRIEAFFSVQPNTVIESHGVTALKAILPILEKLSESSLLTYQIQLSQKRCIKYSSELYSFQQKHKNTNERTTILGLDTVQSDNENDEEPSGNEEEDTKKQEKEDNTKRWGIPVPQSAIDSSNPLIVGVTEVIVDKPATEYEGQNNTGHQFFTYRIIIKCGVPNQPAHVERYYRIRRRFNDLRALHSGLVESTQKSKIKIPQLPPMGKTGSKTVKFVEERRKKMGDYLQAVATIPSLVQTKAFQEFMLTNSEYRSAGEGID